MKNLIIKLWKSDVKTGCCIYENCPIWELGEFEKNKILITWPVLTTPKNLYVRKLIRFSLHHKRTKNLLIFTKKCKSTNTVLDLNVIQWPCPCPLCWVHCLASPNFGYPSVLPNIIYQGLTIPCCVMPLVFLETYKKNPILQNFFSLFEPRDRIESSM
jgi:hypothetical protein